MYLLIITYNNLNKDYLLSEKGKLQVLVNNQLKREIKIGEGFGELALLYNSPRSASIKALENSFLWGIDRNIFRAVVE